MVRTALHDGYDEDCTGSQSGSSDDEDGNNGGQDHGETETEKLD